MSLLKPEIILVEDASKLKTDALIMTVSPSSHCVVVA